MFPTDQGGGADVDSAAIKALHSDLEPVALAADQVLGRDAHIVHHDLGGKGMCYVRIL